MASRIRLCECGQIESSTKIVCENCRLEFRVCCEGIDPADKKIIDDFFCKSCEEKEKLVSSWRGTKPQRFYRIYKEKHYHEVEKIVGHRGSRDNREFLIQWKGYERRFNSWVVEKHLDGCIDTLQSYCRTKGIPTSKVLSVYGATKEVALNKDNWMTAEQIISSVNSYKSSAGYKTSLDFIEFKDSLDKESLYLLGHDFHCYVLCYFPEQKFAYIADGTNRFISDETSCSEIKEMLSIELRPLKFDQQYKADHCGSSAVLIAIAMIKCYKINSCPSELTVTAHLRAKIAKRFHKQDSSTIKPTNSSLNKRLHCKSCGKTYRIEQNRNLRMHEKVCSKLF